MHVLCVFWSNTIHKLLSRKQSFHKTYITTSEVKESSQSTLDTKTPPPPPSQPAAWASMGATPRTLGPGYSGPFILPLGPFGHAQSPHLQTEGL